MKTWRFYQLDTQEMYLCRTAIHYKTFNISILPEIKSQFSTPSIKIGILIQLKIHPVQCPAFNNSRKWTHIGKTKNKACIYHTLPMQSFSLQFCSAQKFSWACHSVSYKALLSGSTFQELVLEANIVHPQPPLARFATCLLSVFIFNLASTALPHFGRKELILMYSLTPQLLSSSSVISSFQLFLFQARALCSPYRSHSLPLLILLPFSELFSSSATAFWNWQNQNYKHYPRCGFLWGLHAVLLFVPCSAVLPL